MKTKNQRAQGVIQKIIMEAWENETFKANLINQPKATLETFFGKSFNSKKEIKVLDQTDPKCIYINIPSKPNLEDVELSEEQLEMVAGGSIDWLVDMWETLTEDTTISDWQDNTTVI